MTEFAALRPKAYSYFSDQNKIINIDQQQATQFENEKKNNKKKVNVMWIVSRNQKVFIKNITKIALSANNDKRIKSADSIEKNAYEKIQYAKQKKLNVTI